MELEELEGLLRVRMEVILPDAVQRTERLWHGSVQWYIDRSALCTMGPQPPVQGWGMDCWRSMPTSPVSPATAAGSWNATPADPGVCEGQADHLKQPRGGRRPAPVNLLELWREGRASRCEATCGTAHWEADRGSRHLHVPLTR